MLESCRAYLVLPGKSGSSTVVKSTVCDVTVDGAPRPVVASRAGVDAAHADRRMDESRTPSVSSSVRGVRDESVTAVGDGGEREVSNGPSQFDAFISYSRRDMPFVRELHEFLVTRDKVVWIDLEDIPPSANWEQNIRAGIESADAVVFVLSPDSLASEVCVRELAHACDLGKRIVPLLHRAVEPTAAPAPLPELNWILCRDEDDRALAYDSVVRALETDLEWVREHTRLLVRAVEWHASSDDRSYLLRGSDLAAAEQWLTNQADKQPTPTRLHLDYILESRRAATRRRRLTLALMLVALAVASTLAVVALLQRNSARRANHSARIAASDALASNAGFELDHDPAKSIGLALDAVRLHPGRNAADMLRVAVAQSRARLILHADDAQVAAATTSPDGSLIATAGSDGTARVWDAANGRLLHTLRGAGDVTAVAFSQDGSLLAVARGSSSVNGRTDVVDLRGGRPTTVLPSRDGGVLDAMFGPHDRLLTGSYFSEAIVWDGRTGRRTTAVRAPDGRILGAALSPDGRLFATVAVDRLQVWDTGAGRQVSSLATGVYLDSVAFSPDGRAVVVTDDDGVASVVDARTGTVMHRLRGASERLVHACFSPDGRYVAAASDDGTARIWRVDGQPVAVLAHDGPVRDIEFSRDGSRVVTASDDGTARVWELPSGNEVATLTGHSERVNTAAFTPDGRHVVTASNDGTARLWYVPSLSLNMRRSEALDLAPANAARRAGSSARLSLSPDWRSYVTTSGSTARVVDASSGATRATLGRPGRTVSAASFSPDGRLVLTTYEDGSADIWRTGSWAQVSSLRGLGLEPDATFSPDGRFLAVRRDNSAVVRVWDTGSGRRIAELRGHRHTPLGGVLAASFSADGRRLVTAGADGTARVWDTRTWRPLAVLHAGSAEVIEASFSRDGSRLVTASGDGNARLWKADGTRIATLRTSERTSPGEDGIADVSAAFSLDGSLLSTVGGDGTARTWDGISGRPLAVLRPAQEPRRQRLPTARATLPVTSVEFDPSGDLIATMGFDGTARIWEARTGDALAVYRQTGTPTTGGDTNYARFAPDGEHVLAETDTAGIELLECGVCMPLEQLIELAQSRLRHATP